MIRVDNNGSSSALIQVRGVNKTYRRGGENIQVLQGLNLDVDKGDFVAFMGPSGSGRTSRSIPARRFPTFSPRRASRCSTCLSRTPSSSWIASTANRSATCSIVVLLLQ